MKTMTPLPSRKSPVVIINNSFPYPIFLTLALGFPLIMHATPAAAEPDAEIEVKE